MVGFRSQRKVAKCVLLVYCRAPEVEPPSLPPFPSRPAQGGGLYVKLSDFNRTPLGECIWSGKTAPVSLLQPCALVFVISPSPAPSVYSLLCTRHCGHGFTFYRRLYISCYDGCWSPCFIEDENFEGYIGRIARPQRY